MNEIEFQSEVEEACGILKEIVDTLRSTRRKMILDSLSQGESKTFDQLKSITGISTGSLHHHLKELWLAGFIYKTTERPMKYGKTDFLNYLIKLIKKENEQTENIVEDVIDDTTKPSYSDTAEEPITVS